MTNANVATYKKYNSCRPHKDIIYNIEQYVTMCRVGRQTLHAHSLIYIMIATAHAGL